MNCSPCYEMSTNMEMYYIDNKFHKEYNPRWKITTFDNSISTKVSSSSNSPIISKRTCIGNIQPDHRLSVKIWLKLFNLCNALHYRKTWDCGAVEVFRSNFRVNISWSNTRLSSARLDCNKLRSCKCIQSE